MQPLDGGVILPHENVRVGPVEDRLALMRAMQGNPEPIFLLYDGGGAATATVRRGCARDPAGDRGDRRREHDTTCGPSPTSRAWRRSPPTSPAAQAMIADGHHRYTTYGYLRDELRDAAPEPDRGTPG